MIPFKIGVVAASIRTAITGNTDTNIDVVDQSAVVFTSATTYTMTIPATAQNGDMLVACLMHRDTATAPAGWVYAASSGTFTYGTFKQITSIFIKKAGPSDAGQTVTFEQGVTDRIAGQVLVIRSTRALVVAGVGGNMNLNTMTTQKTIPQIQASKDGQLAIAAVSWIYASTGATSTGNVSSPWQQTTPSESTDTADQIRLGVAHRGISYPETTGGAFTVNESGLADGGAMVLIDLEPIYDAEWDNVASLLHFNGVDGSTTFNDEKGWAWTASEDAQISTAQSKFGGASGLFDSQSSGVDHIYSNDTPMDITQDFTIECFIYWDGSGQSTFYQWYEGVNSGFYARVEPSGVIQTYTCGGTFDSVVTTTTIPIETWVHVALVMENGTLKIFINGNIEATGAVTQPTANPVNFPPIIGYDHSAPNRQFRGHIDEFRFTNGVARHIGNFAAPTEPYPSAGVPPALKARNEITIALVVNAPSHGATVNTKQALLDAGFLDANITVHQDTTAPPAADVIVICRAIDSQSDWDMIAPAWQAGTPVIFGSKNGQTDQSDQDHAATYAGLANAFYAQTLTTYESIEVFCNTHYITAHMPLGDNLFYTGGSNYMYALSAPGNHVGLPLAHGDSDNPNFDRPTLIALEKGIDDLNGNKVPVRSVIFADLYGGQNPYTVAGREVIARSIEWCLGYELA